MFVCSIELRLRSRGRNNGSTHDFADLHGGKTDTTDGISEDELSALERKALMTLARNPLTMARMEHMLDTGKPLRN